MNLKNFTGIKHMNMPMNINKSKLYFFLYNPLLRNSLFIILSSIISAGFGFVFFFIAAKLYLPEDVGIATSLVSSITLIGTFSRFGLDFSIIRFFPEYDKSKILSTSIFITTICSIILGIVYIREIDVFSPELQLLQSTRNAIIYLIVLVASSWVSLMGISFIAIRKAGLNLFQNLLMGTRIIFLFLSISLGAIGIFTSIGISFIISIIAVFSLLKRYGIGISLNMDSNFLKESFRFSAANYVANLLMSAPSMLLPIMVLNTLGPKSAAYYYISYSIVSMLFMIPSAISMSLFVEGSHGVKIKNTVIKSIAIITPIIIPMSIVLYFCSPWILRLISSEYAAGGVAVMKTMVLAIIFVSINYIYIAVKRIQKDTIGLIIVGGINFVFLLGFSHIFMLRYGIIGVGYAWVIGNGIGSIWIAIDAFKEKWF